MLRQQDRFGTFRIGLRRCRSPSGGRLIIGTLSRPDSTLWELALRAKPGMTIRDQNNRETASIALFHRTAIATAGTRSA